MNKTLIQNNFLIKAICAFLFILGAALLPFHSSAQEEEGINYGAQLDTNVIVIGDQINLQLSVEQPKGMRVDFPVFSDSIVSGIEIIKQTPQDTTSLKNGLIKVNKNFLITSFDGGVYKLKPFEFQVHSDNYMNVIRTDTMALGVRTFEIDTTKANFDIVMPIHTPVSFGELAPWVFGGLIFVALIVFLIWYFRWRKQDQPLFAISKPVEPAHVIALRKLDEIKEQKLWQSGKIKQFHSELTDTIRIYLDERYNLTTLESTTDEILTAVNSLEINHEWHANLQEVLERADFAKFAKFQPLPNENERSLQYAYRIVETTIVKEEPEAEKEETPAPKGENEENK